MGCDSKKKVKCQCRKKVKKPEKVPQRGPGVAELEKILGHHPPEKMNPFHSHFMFRHHPPRPLSLLGSHVTRTDYFRRLNDYGVSSNLTRSEQMQETNPDPNYGLSFTQMMTMDDEHPLFQLSMESVCPSNLITTANPRLESFTKYSLSRDFHNKIGLEKIQTNLQSLQLGQSGMEQGNTAEASEMHDAKRSGEIVMTLSLGPQKDTERSSESQEGRNMQIFGFNLEEKYLSVDRKRQSLGNIGEASSPLEHDLDVELKL